MQRIIFWTSLSTVWLILANSILINDILTRTFLNLISDRSDQTAFDRYIGFSKWKLYQCGIQELS